MVLLKILIDIAIILLLVRLLIGATASYYNPIYGLIYRVTDPVLVPSRYVSRRPTSRIMLTVLALVVLRGAVYVSLKREPFLTGIGISLLELCQLLFLAYMVMWFVSVFSHRGFGTPFYQWIERAFIPVNRVLIRLGIPKRRYYLTLFLFLWILYALLSTFIRYVTGSHTVPMFFGLGEGLILIVGLFPGFFSVIIIIGALLSWVSPDPSNPIVQAIYGISEPLLRPFRRFVPLLGGLDMSPIVALLCFQILGRLCQQLIASLMGMV